MEQKWSECKIHNKKKEKGSKKGEYSKTKLARIPIAMSMTIDQSVSEEYLGMHLYNREWTPSGR